MINLSDSKSFAGRDLEWGQFSNYRNVEFTDSGCSATTLNLQCFQTNIMLEAFFASQSLLSIETIAFAPVLDLNKCSFGLFLYLLILEVIL